MNILDYLGNRAKQMTPSLGRFGCERCKRRGRGTRVGLGGVALVIAFLGASVPAAAEESEADRTFRQGQQHLERGKISEACALFELSLKREEATGTLVNLAFCHEKEGKPVRAWNEFKRAETRAQGERLEFVREHLATLERKVGHARVDTGGRAVLEIKVDGELTSLDDKGRITSEPGSHGVVVSIDGKVSKQAMVSLKVGNDNPPIRPTFESDPPPTPATAATPVVEDGTSGPASTKRTVGLVLAGVGAASFAVALGFYGEMLRIKHETSRDPRGCPGMLTCSPEGLMRIKTNAQTQANFATGFDILGGLALAAGIYLVVTSAAGSPPSKTRVVTSLAAEGGRLGLEGVW